MSKAELLVLLGGQRETLRRRYGVKSLAVFGSAARDAMSATSDIDVLVEFDTSPGFDNYFDLKILPGGIDRAARGSGHARRTSQRASCACRGGSD